MKYTLGHKTVLEIHPGKPIMYVASPASVPLSFRTAELKAPKKSKPKKVRYAGSPDK